MIKPEDYDKIVKPILDIFNDIEEEMLQRIAFDLKYQDEETDVVEWYLKKLAEMGKLNKDLEKIIKLDNSDLLKDVQKVFNEVGSKTFNETEIQKAFEKDLINDPSPFFTETFSRIIQEAIVNELQDLYTIKSTALQMTNEQYRRIITSAYVKVSSGSMNLNEAINTALKEFADKGIQYATYENGYKIGIEAAIRRDTITKANQLATEMNNEFCKDLNVEYVETTAHFGARDEHAIWQGKVFKKSELAEKTGYGTVTGLGGANCRHSFYPFFPGISEKATLDYNKAENKRFYDLTQEQRKYERTIRKYKKRELMFTNAGNEVEAQKAKELKNKWSSELNKFIKENDELRRDYEREKI